MIDIVGNGRIQGILEDPAHFILRAVRAETLQDWISDTGAYLSRAKCRMHNGVYRTSDLADSGIPAVLRHQFWMPEEAGRVVGRTAASGPVERALEVHCVLSASVRRLRIFFERF